MRFSYIDSQGKEIEVDSVESLALRIELGAIKPDTRLYDAVADRWAPAEEHPVYRSLSRGEELTEEDVVHIGQERGPAPAAEGAEEDAGEEDGPAGEEETADEEEETADEEDEPEGREEAAEEEEAEPETAGAERSGDALDLDFQVTLSEEEEGAADAGPTGQPEPAEEAAPETEAPAGPGEEDEEDDGFGDFGALELEEEEPEESASTSETLPDEAFPEGPAVAEGEDEGLDEDGGEPSPAETAPSSDQEMPSWAAEGEALWDDDEDADAASADEERPPPPPEPDERMPAWAAEEPADAPTPAPEPEKPEEGRRIEKPSPPRPAHWEERTRTRERRQRWIRIGGGALLVVAAGTAAAFGLQLGPFERAPEAAEGPVRPVLPAELRSATTDVAQAAYSDVLEAFREEWDERELPESPPEEWLEGVYLSTAGDYPAVRAYWESVGDAVAALQDREPELFRERLDARLEEGVAADGLTETEVARVREAALFDFEATAPERTGVYGSVLGVADASLDLHSLLVEREADIAYEPYSDPGVSRDPVLEAVPTDSLLRVEMNERLDRVLEAVADSGLPRPITTDSVGEHLLERLREAGVVMSNPPPPASEGSG